MRHAGARRRTRRLLRRLSRRRPRHEDRAGGAICRIGRCLPQRRLHSLKGAVARCRRGGRSSRTRARRHHLWQAGGATGRPAQIQGQGRRKADQRTGRHGQDAEGHRGPRRRAIPGCEPSRGGGHHGQGPGKNRREEGGQVRPSHHRRRLAGGPPAVHSGRSAHHRFDRRAETRLDSQEDARHRRGHHRPRNGHGVFHARRTARCGGNARRIDARRRPGSRQGLAKDERETIRQGHGEDAHRGGGGQAGRHLRQVRGGRRANGTAALRRGVDERRPRPQWEENQRRARRSPGHRPRVHPHGLADAHQCAAHLCHRRHRRPTHAGAQGGA